MAYRDNYERDYRSNHRDRDRGSLMERIKNDVKSWFDDDDDNDREYRSQGYSRDNNYGRENQGSRYRQDSYGYPEGDRGYGRNERSQRRSAGAYGLDSDAGGYYDRGDEPYESSSRRPFESEERYQSRSGSNYGQDYGQDYDYRSGRSDEYPDDDSYSSSGYSGSQNRILYSRFWVVPGPYSGVGPKGYSRSPEALKERVCERLQDDGRIDASNIEIECNDCEITLKGTVKSRSEKRLAEDCAESIRGVEDVHNRLRIDKQGSRQSESLSTSSSSSKRKTSSRSAKTNGNS